MIRSSQSVPMVTVFTATFNRGEKIHRVFDSLMAQTLAHHLFEWIVIDDGSADDTGRVIEHFEAKADFAIVYRYQQNRGKHIAYNRAVSLARGELFLTCDSADAFEPNGLEFFCTQWTSLSPAEKLKYSGINARCRDQNGAIVSSAMPRTPIALKNPEAIIIHGMKGDRWGVMRTEVMREFPFPEGHIGSHYPEVVIWNRIGRKYGELYTNEVLCTIYLDTTNSITRNELAKDRRKLAAKCLRESADFLNHDFGYFFSNPIFFVKRALIYNYYRRNYDGSLEPDQRLHVWPRIWCAFFRILEPVAAKAIGRKNSTLIAS